MLTTQRHRRLALLGVKASSRTFFLSGYKFLVFFGAKIQGGVLLKKLKRHHQVFHPILVTLFMVVFVNEVTIILLSSLFIFHFVSPILPCKWKTSYRKSCNLNDEKPITKLTKYVMSRARVIVIVVDYSYYVIKFLNMFCPSNAFE
jgi:hypothetical protein